MIVFVLSAIDEVLGVYATREAAQRAAVIEAHAQAWPTYIEWKQQPNPDIESGFLVDVGGDTDAEPTFDIQRHAVEE